MHPAAWVEVDLGAIAANARAILRTVRPARLIAVVKEDAYGHGAPRVAKALRGIADAFAVASVAEGGELRRAGIGDPILVLSPVHPAERAHLNRERLTPTAGALADLAAIRVSRGHFGGQLKFDTGMGRLGFSPDQAGEVARRLRSRGVRSVAGTYTHLAAAEEPRFTTAQLTRFDLCLAVLREQGIDAGVTHAANSEAIHAGSRACAYGAVRPGLMLYGCSTARSRPPFPLRPAMALKARIAAVKSVGRGATVSYGHTWTACRGTKLGVLPIGYAGGYSRALSNGGRLLVGGRRVPVLGRVCMNLTVADVTYAPGARVGSEAVLFGRQGKAAVTADELARLAGTIPYELLCTAGSLNPRLYQGAARG